MNRILVIANGESDLLKLLKEQLGAVVISTESDGFDTESFDALCVLAGTENLSLNLSAPLQWGLNKMREEGKPVFCEFLGSIGATRRRKVISTERQRMVYFSKGFDIEGLADGDLLDGQSNECVTYAPLIDESRPLLAYREYASAHSNIKISEEEHKEGTWALFWFDKNTLVSSIRLCNFHRARFAPRGKWHSIISFVISFLAGDEARVKFDAPVCSFHTAKVRCVTDTDVGVRRGIDWITNSGMLYKGGAGGVHEGFTNRIWAQSGIQHKHRNVRADCTGEIGGALLFDYFLTGNADSKKKADALFKFNFDWMQVKGGEHNGMLRWSEAAWETCFQDDVARALLPLLLSQHFGEEVPYLENIKSALDYMLRTTGEDGIRINSTEIYNTSPELTDKLKKAGSGTPSAHFNAYYHAALLLAYRACGKEEYLTYAERGLSTLMSLYPNTYRETSETEENARLVFPLAVLYGITGKKEHYDWLCRVTDELEKHRHESGGYAEWDTGYKAACSRNHRGECALLADNGDPVADLLYSNNWLPIGFAYAYLVTGEKRFFERWTSVASFMLSSQMHSDNKLLDGAWARAFDMEAKENYGMPHDAGWGPYCIESGWTVGEILMGLQFMKVVGKSE